jgi:hypothetical protein
VFPEAIVLESCSVSILFHIIRVLHVMIPVRVSYFLWRVMTL